MATIPPASEALKIKSVKELPQSRQVPKMYNSAFTHKVLTDTHMVTRAIRTDISTIYELLEEIVLELNRATNSIADLEAEVSNLASRVSALESAQTSPEE